MTGEYIQENFLEVKKYCINFKTNCDQIVKLPTSVEKSCFKSAIVKPTSSPDMLIAMIKFRKYIQEKKYCRELWDWTFQTNLCESRPDCWILGQLLEKLLSTEQLLKSTTQTAEIKKIEKKYFRDLNFSDIFTWITTRFRNS